MFVESPVAIPLSFESTKYLSMEDKMKTLLQNRQEALAAHELARSQMTDKWRSTFTPFKKGDQVWLDSRNMKTIYHKKMKPKWEECFVITKVLGLVTYRLKHPKSIGCNTGAGKTMVLQSQVTQVQVQVLIFRPEATLHP